MLQANVENAGCSPLGISSPSHCASPNADSSASTGQSCNAETPGGLNSTPQATVITEESILRRSVRKSAITAKRRIAACLDAEQSLELGLNKSQAHVAKSLVFEEKEGLENNSDTENCVSAETKAWEGK